jgi:hypothetical protein
VFQLVIIKLVIFIAVQLVIKVLVIFIVVLHNPKQELQNLNSRVNEKKSLSKTETGGVSPDTRFAVLNANTMNEGIVILIVVLASSERRNSVFEQCIQ